MTDAWSDGVQRFYGDRHKLAAVDRRHDVFVRAYRAVGDILEVDADSVLLDVGCGAGALAGALNGRTAGYLGIDVCREVLALARRRNPAAEFRVQDVTELNCPAGFDCAAALSCLEFCADKPAALSAIHRALKPGGRLYVEVRNADFVGWRMTARLRRVLRGIGVLAGPEVAHHEFRDLGVTEWMRLLQEAGFKVQRARRSIRPTGYGGIGTFLKNVVIRMAASTTAVGGHYMVGLLCARA